MNKFKADLRLMLRDWYGYHWHNAQKELAAAREIAHQQQVALDKSRQAQTEIDQKLANSREQIQSLRLCLSGWHRESAHFIARVNLPAKSWLC